MKYSKYFGAKRRGFIKIKGVLVPKGALHLLSENISYDSSHAQIIFQASFASRGISVRILLFG
jgi:hypothetical protein